jgi:PAS domain S-box-containing protein
MNTCINLLVVEDKPADFRLIVRHLEKHGMDAHCRCVTNREELEAAVEQGGWDAVLSDYSVPKLDFQHTLALLQARHHDLPLILVSGSIGEERAVELLKLGVWDFLLKDNLTRLVPAIERSLRDVADRRERRRADAALRESEERYAWLAEQSGTFIWEVDAQGLYTYVSPVVEKVLGYRPDELIGRMHYYDLHPESGREAFKANAFEVFQRKEPFTNFINAAQTKDGRDVWLVTTGQPLLDADERFLGYQGSDTDITERMRHEAELLKMDKLQSVGTLAGGIAHDFNNILQGLYGNLSPALLA